jgi:hypothetical protein
MKPIARIMLPDLQVVKMNKWRRACWRCVQEWQGTQYLQRTRFIFTMAQMVYVKVALGFPSNQGTNVFMYWTQVVPPHPLIALQPIPLKLIATPLMVAVKPPSIWAITFMIIDWIVEHPWKQNPPLFIWANNFVKLKHKWNHECRLKSPRANGKKLGGCGYMTSYDPFDMRICQTRHMEGQAH